MNMTEFFEQLATDVHYSTYTKQLIGAQTTKMQEAMNTNSSALVHNQLGDVGYLAIITSCVELS